MDSSLLYDMEQRKRQRSQLGHGCRMLLFRGFALLGLLLFGSQDMSWEQSTLKTGRATRP